MDLPDPPHDVLARIAAALERLAPPAARAVDWHAAQAFVWERDGEAGWLRPVAQVARIELDLLCGIARVAEQLYENTRRFAEGLPANNALLWGARGMGKSSLVKAVHGRLSVHHRDLLLIEVHREDLPSLPALLRLLSAATAKRCLVFCDDLSFDSGDTSYKSLKAILEGGIEGRPDNVLFYATSNRRHLLAREMIENERRAAIHETEVIQEKVSLSDRFGLWLGFHQPSQDAYLAMIRGYVSHYRLNIDEAAWRPRAIEWQATRGARSGRVAWQFVQDLAGGLGQRLQEPPHGGLPAAKRQEGA